MTPAPVVRIHFQSPPDDEHKIPRPFILKAADDPGGIEVLGGELPGTLVGIIDQLEAPNIVLDGDHWIDVHQLVRLLDGMSALGDVDKYRGWYPVMQNDTGQWQTYDMKIDRVEFRVPDPQPLTGTRDVDWLRAEVDTHWERTAAGLSRPRVTHTAFFGISTSPTENLDLKTPYGSYIFRPEFMTAQWINGEPTYVNISGSRRLKGGGVGKQTCDWQQGYKNSLVGSITPEEIASLPAPIVFALSTYTSRIDLRSDVAASIPDAE